MSFLRRIQDPELRERVRRILVRLQMIQEAGAIPIQRSVAQGKPGSKPPPETRPDRDRAKPPPKDRSLFEWYVWHYERAEDDRRFRTLTFLAERDYAEYEGMAPGKRWVRDRDAGGEKEQDDAKEAQFVIDAFEGVEVTEVAILGRYSVGWVRTLRERARRDPEWGRPLPGWHGWDDEQRAREVNRLAVRGWGQQRVATELGVAKRTVQRYWQRGIRRAA